MRRKFTLIEILIVIGIIGLLAALSFGAYTFAMNKSRESATKALLKRVEAGLESCKTKYGYYPPSGTYSKVKVTFVSASDNTIAAIEFNGTNLSAEMLKEFLRIVDAESLKKSVTKDSSGNYYLTDSWGNPVWYQYPGTVFNKDAIVVISAGADGKWGESTDTPDTSPLNNAKSTSDDLIN